MRHVELPDDKLEEPTWPDVDPWEPGSTRQSSSVTADDGGRDRTRMSVLVCDDHRLFAETFAFVLSAKGHEVAGCVDSPDEAVRVVASRAIDVAVMDLLFPAGSGIEGIAQVIAASPTTRVVGLSDRYVPVVLASAVRAGAQGIAVKEHDLDRLVHTIERVHAGECLVDLNAVAAETAGGHGVNGRARGGLLTRREQEVLEHLVGGASTPELAKAMRVRHSTARTYIQHVLTKLGVHSKLQAVAYAVNNRIVPPS
jgi:two-component system nitrate/nitrite response regulator NarL